MCSFTAWSVLNSVLGWKYLNKPQSNLEFQSSLYASNSIYDQIVKFLRHKVLNLHCIIFVNINSYIPLYNKVIFKSDILEY